ncbi:helix-turn-helix domain-containing protein [Spirosoma sp. HMF3257]|uniref:AraC family transcriptional regulator n=1 Tax=Spirosoma telluris TaxID=2183553 RepID=A0A327NUZ1_9BACT|nr:helix-turn-helix domain-containing protein [Spirosoma telluris]RAI78209.1 AraC family transcriptional regulator [Spirosoma telluris]
MTFYHQQLIKIRDEVYPDAYVCKRIGEAKRFMDRELECSMSLADIAEEASFSTFHFIRLFKRLYGQTPYQYLIAARIAKAKRLLLSGKTVKDVCFSVGFESTSSFTGLFKKLTGSTPTAFKNKYVKQKSGY